MEFICSVIRGDEPRFPGGDDDGFWRDLASVAELHGVEPLLFDKATRHGLFESWPPGLQNRLRRATNAMAARELLAKREIVPLWEHLARAGISALLLKGAPLAYTHYSQPFLRPRGDTDILVPLFAVPAAREVLAGAGYAADLSSRRTGSYQENFVRRLAANMAFSIDLHWRVANLQILSRTLSFEDLFRDSAEVPALCPGALAPTPVHALVIACMHRVSNMRTPYRVGSEGFIEPNRLIWLYDIHLLCERLSTSEWSDFADVAAALGLREICLAGLRVASAKFGTIIPEHVVDRLAAPGPREPSARYLKSGFLKDRIIDFFAIPGWGERLRLLAGWTFPSADHMLARYKVSSRWLLPLLYLRRAAEVSRKLLLTHHSRE